MANTMLSVILDALEDVKAQDIQIFDTADKTAAFSHVVICSGTSNRQTRALANSVARAVKKAHGTLNGIEGADTGEWVLVDCGSIVVHCLQPAMRGYYNLEELWGPKSVDLDPLRAMAKAAKEAALAAEKAQSDAE